jgi:CheY-like chemotaxis protein
LIVDDNFFNLIPLELVLRETFGLATDKALNGQEAVMKFAKHNIQEKPCECGVRYRLVLMDLNMPVMDGYEASQEIMRLHKMLMEQEQIKNNNKNNNGEAHKTAGSGESCHTIAGGGKKESLFIVAVTAFVNEENILNCYKSGMVDVVHKPVNVESIRNILDLYYYQRNVPHTQ